MLFDFKRGQCWWLIPVILATQEALSSKPAQAKSEILSQKYTT
jgi:hypothetical protein